MEQRKKSKNQTENCGNPQFAVTKRRRDIYENENFYMNFVAVSNQAENKEKVKLKKLRNTAYLE